MSRQQEIGRQAGPQRTRRASPRRVYQLKVTLGGSKPPIWRRLQVPGNITLAGLHMAIQIAMGWLNCHLYRFRIAGEEYGEELEDDPWFDMREATRAVLQRLVPFEGSTFLYEYDYGDGWRHSVKVERILPAQESVTCPTCLAGRRACPPEDCGGIGGYYRLLEIIADPAREEHDEMVAWLGGPWDPDHFSLDEVNVELRCYSW
ncbi:MAG: plasmid pRiA4b ORF-3 family protein [bacterium]|nr:plasmid pRiA4b ORF-3 family protein [bacterium]